jgi:hypothetical protein
MSTRSFAAAGALLLGALAASPDINSAGEIAGSSLTADFETHATLWTRR